LPWKLCWALSRCWCNSFIRLSLQMSCEFITSLSSKDFWKLLKVSCRVRMVPSIPSNWSFSKH
jgi:hypothetical protein